MTTLPYEDPPTNKSELVERLKEILQAGWFDTRTQHADGKVGNTLEDLLGLEENNLSLPDVGEYELKTKRRKTGSLTTLFHYDPFPRKKYSGRSHRSSPVQGILLPQFGWQHQEYEDEKSFRTTLSGEDWNSRGFRTNVDEDDQRIYIEFNKDQIDCEALQVGNLHKLKDDLPSALPEKLYWEFNHVEQKLHSKLRNMIFVYASSRGEGKNEEFNYTEAEIWEGVNFNEFLSLIKSGGIKIDFDARTNHNHGTKFRISKSSASMEDLYKYKCELM